MSKLTKWLYLSTLVFVLLTLVKEYPPYRLYLLDLALAPLVVMVIFQRLVEPGRLSFKWQGVDTLMLLLMFAITLAFMFSGSRAQSTVEYVDWLRILGVYFCSRALMTSIVDDKIFGNYLKFSGLLLLAIGLIQVFTNSKFGLVGNYFGSGLDQGVAANVEGYGSKHRVSGTTSNPIIYAVWLSIFVLYFLADLCSKGRHFLFFALTAISSFVVLNTLSRGAIAAFFISWLILVYLNRRDLLTGRFFVAFIMFLLVAIPVSYMGLNRIGMEETVSILEGRFTQQDLLEEDSGRMTVINMGLELLAHPKVFLVGTGPGNMIRAYENYSTEVRRIHQGASYARSGVHNVWIKMLVEYGIIAAILYILIWVAIIRRVIHFNKCKESDRKSIVYVKYILAFIIPFLFLDCMVYESAMSYHELIPIFALLALLVSKTESIYVFRDKEAVVR